MTDLTPREMIAQKRMGIRNPQPRHVRRDEAGRALYRFEMTYMHDGKPYGFDIWAYDHADAEAKAASMSSGVTVAGQIYANVG